LSKELKGPDSESIEGHNESGPDKHLEKPNGDKEKPVNPFTQMFREIKLFVLEV
jgi:hypothetical protein